MVKDMAAVVFVDEVRVRARSADAMLVLLAI